MGIKSTMIKPRDVVALSFAPIGRLRWSVFEILSIGSFTSLALLAFLNGWSGRDKLTVASLFAGWVSLISVSYRFRRLHQLPRMSSWEILEDKLCEGIQLLDAIADTSKPIPRGQPERWIGEALGLLRSHNLELSRDFKRAAPTAGSAFERPDQYELASLSAWVETGRKPQWDKLRDHLRVFERFDAEPVVFRP